MEMTYQERLFFLDRYKNIVFGYTTEELFAYTALLREKLKELFFETDKQKRKKLKAYIKSIDIFKLDINLDNIKIDQDLSKEQKIKAVEYEIRTQAYENLHKLVEKMGNNRYEYIILKYAERDCDCAFTTDCANELTRKMKEHWQLSDNFFISVRD